MVNKRLRISSEIEHRHIFSEDSDSTDNSDYNENEKILLSKVKRKHNDDSDSNQAMFDVAYGDDDYDSDESNIALSDIDNNENEDDLPNLKAWGKDKRSYYSTDYVDPGYSGYVGKDALNADFEEEEAQKLQLQLANQFEEEDFLMLDIEKKSPDKDIEIKTEIVKTDIWKLTKREQINVLKKESPEFFNLINDFKEKIQFIAYVLLPRELSEIKQITKSEALNIVIIYKELLLNYCINITMYLLLKTQHVKLQSHPVIKRLLQYRELIAKMNTIYQTLDGFKININEIRNEVVNRKQPAIAKEMVKKCTNNTVKKVSQIVDNDRKNVLAAFEKHVQEKDDESTKKVELNSHSEIDEKRAITYQMKRNKGLMPSRKKEQRNPRVKHRNKFRRAQIRRKGAVRDVRTEVSRYGGEISGIKASVTKGIKIK